MQTDTFKQTELLGHFLGINLYHARKSRKKGDKKLPKEFYRNRFCAGETHDDFPALESMERGGLVARGAKINNGLDTLWYVTEKGIEQFNKDFNTILSPDNQ